MSDITLSSLPGLFVVALRKINREVSDLKLKGRRKYYTVYDAKEVWRKSYGQCYDCGIFLNPRSNKQDSGTFTHRIPINLGGKIHIDNLILVCPLHKENRDKKRKSPSKKIIGYNAISDIIVQLVQAVIEKDNNRIQYFKQEFDLQLKDIVDSKYYPIENIKSLDHIPNKNISAHIEELTNILIKEFEIVGQTKTYDISRE